MESSCTEFGLFYSVEIDLEPLRSFVLLFVFLPAEIMLIWCAKLSGVNSDEACTASG